MQTKIQKFVQQIQDLLAKSEHRKLLERTIGLLWAASICPPALAIIHNMLSPPHSARRILHLHRPCSSPRVGWACTSFRGTRSWSARGEASPQKLAFGEGCGFACNGSPKFSPNRRLGRYRYSSGTVRRDLVVERGTRSLAFPYQAGTLPTLGRWA